MNAYKLLSPGLGLVNYLVKLSIAKLMMTAQDFYSLLQMGILKHKVVIST